MLGNHNLNSETCWNDQGFRNFWDDVASALDDHDFLGSVPDEDWQVDEILSTYKAEGSVEDAVKALEEGFDPTPQTAYEFFH